MALHQKAYLDIETSFSGYITVLGIFRPPFDLIQVVHPDVSQASLLGALDGAHEIVTYWGHRFDLPVINQMLGINLRDCFRSKDLADDCHRHGLFGGLKAVESILGMDRQTKGLSGTDALILWERWQRGDDAALKVLLRYNEDDVVNLYQLEKRLLELDMNQSRSDGDS